MTKWDLAVAIVLLKRGDPVPIDLHARLIEAGYDVETMERTYNP